MRTNLFYAMSIAAMLTACSNNDDPKAPEYGTIDLSVSKEVSVVTRASHNATQKELANYLLSIKNASGATVQTPVLYSEKVAADGTMTFNTGTDYTLTLESCTEETAESANTNWGQQRIAGTSSAFNVTTGQTTPVTVNCTVQTAKVSVAYDSGFQSVFTGYTVEIQETSNTGRTLIYTSEATHEHATQLGYFNIDATPELSYTVKGRFNGSDIKTLTTGTFTPEKAKWHKLTFKAADNGQISLTVTIDDAVTDAPQEIPVNPYQ